MIKGNDIIGALSILITCAILIPVISSCSVVGLTIGAALDDNRPDRVIRPVIDMNQITPGRNIEVILLSNNILEGKFKGTGILSQKEYDSIFREYLNDSNELNAFPAPGDTITILDLSGKQLIFILIGYGMGYLSVHSVGEDKTIAILTRHISSMYLNNGETISGSNIEKMLSERKLPVIETLILDLDGRIREVPADSIVQITELDKNYRIWIGLAAGAVVDLAVVILYIHAVTQGNWE